MMPSDTKFNGASNDAVAGRARSLGQRNLLSYLRGAVDVIDDPRTGRPVEQLLRGRGSDTWGAVAMTFVNDRGGQFTVLRTYYVPRRATRSGDVQMQLVTHDGPLRGWAQCSPVKPSPEVACSASTRAVWCSSCRTLRGCLTIPSAWTSTTVAEPGCSWRVSACACVAC